MKEYDLFDLTGLEFDQKYENAKTVYGKINNKINSLKDEIRNKYSDSIYLGNNAIIKFLEEEIDVILSKDKKTTTFKYSEIVNEKREREINNLKADAKLLYLSGTRTATVGMIKSFEQKTGLSKERIGSIFMQSGFKTSNGIKSLPTFPNLADDTYIKLETWRRCVNDNKIKCSETLEANLFDFTKYIDNKSDLNISYRGMETKGLRDLLENYAKDKSQENNDKLVCLCRDIAILGYTYNFNSDYNRKAYERYLKCRSTKLGHLFALIKILPKSILHNPKFAEECIRQINEVFGDYGEALLMYNYKAFPGDEFYIPNQMYTVVCKHCSNSLMYNDLAESQKINRCYYCGNPLYKQCNRCKTKVIQSEMFCTKCKYDFGKEENALQTELSDLVCLIASKKFSKASIEAAKMNRGNQNVNIIVIKNCVDAVLAKAQTKYTVAERLDVHEKADVCLNILKDCADFKPAIEYLKANPPDACNNFVSSFDNTNTYVNVSWSPSYGQEITYTLVRKNGNKIPVNEKDGDILIEDTIKTSYRDHSILQGQAYSYAVFAKRYGGFSTATGNTVVNHADVTDIVASQSEKDIYITWKMPNNCVSVTIQRTFNGQNETVLNKKTVNSYYETNIKYSNRYLYKICANYSDNFSSKGVSVSIVPTRTVKIPLRVQASIAACIVLISIIAGATISYAYFRKSIMPNNGNSLNLNGKESSEDKTSDVQDVSTPTSFSESASMIVPTSTSGTSLYPAYTPTSEHTPTPAQTPKHTLTPSQTPKYTPTMKPNPAYTSIPKTKTTNETTLTSTLALTPIPTYAPTQTTTPTPTPAPTQTPVPTPTRTLATTSTPEPKPTPSANMSPTHTPVGRETYTTQIMTRAETTDSYKQSKQQPDYEESEAGLWVPPIPNGNDELTHSITNGNDEWTPPIPSENDNLVPANPSENDEWVPPIPDDL